MATTSTWSEVRKEREYIKECPFARCYSRYISFVSFYHAIASFPEESVLIGDKYDFDVVFSTEPDFLRTIPTPAPAPVIKQKSVPQSTPASKEKSLISLLLKDPSSVDVCFTFTNNKACSNIGLWAHRFLLSQHDSFAKAIQD